LFKVMAGSVEEYFRFDPNREDDLRAVDALIRAAAPSLARWFVPGTPAGEPGMTMTMIGYGLFEYTVKSSATPIRWPVLGQPPRPQPRSARRNDHRDRGRHRGRAAYGDLTARDGTPRAEGSLWPGFDLTIGRIGPAPNCHSV